MTTDRDEIEAIRQRLQSIEVERERLAARLRELERARPEPVVFASVAEPRVTNSSPAPDKIALFRRLLAGRADVFPVRWENPKTGRSGYAPACANEWIRGICGKPQVKCGECPNQAFIPVSNEAIECHLRGEDRVRPNGRGGNFVAGVYPLLFDDTCNFLAVDFDGEQWATDALAFMATCRELEVPARWEAAWPGRDRTPGSGRPRPGPVGRRLSLRDLPKNASCGWHARASRDPAFTDQVWESLVGHCDRV